MQLKLNIQPILIIQNNSYIDIISLVETDKKCKNFGGTDSLESLGP
jgi:hypothetical protein